MRADQFLLAFNRGVVGGTALARVDVKRLAMSAETQTNFMARAFGPMSLRPGLQYVGLSPIAPEAAPPPVIGGGDGSYYTYSGYSSCSLFLPGYSAAPTSPLYGLTGPVGDVCTLVPFLNYDHDVTVSQSYYLHRPTVVDIEEYVGGADPWTHKADILRDHGVTSITLYGNEDGMDGGSITCSLATGLIFNTIGNSSYRFDYTIETSAAHQIISGGYCSAGVWLPDTTAWYSLFSVYGFGAQGIGPALDAEFGGISWHANGAMGAFWKLRHLWTIDGDFVETDVVFMSEAQYLAETGS